MHITVDYLFTLPFQRGAMLEMPTGIYGRCGLHDRCEKLDVDFFTTPYCLLFAKPVPF